VLKLLLQSKKVLAALKLCSLIRFRILLPFSFLWGFLWGPSSSEMVSTWKSKSLSTYLPVGGSMFLVPMEAFRSVPMMTVVFLTGILLRNSENSWVVFSISSSLYPEWGGSIVWY
jgi:hypothetical protein